jgi:hypothetical protein
MEGEPACPEPARFGACRKAPGERGFFGRIFLSHLMPLVFRIVSFKIGNPIDSLLFFI